LYLAWAQLVAGRPANARALPQGPRKQEEPIAGRSSQRQEGHGKLRARDLHVAPAARRDRGAAHAVRRLLRRYARTRGTAAQKKDPVLVETLPALLAPIGPELAGLRDRALILLGYAGAFRRAELVAIDVEDLRFSKKGLYVWIAGAKNDPRRRGRELYVPRLPNPKLCAVVALERWLEIVGTSGPVFRTFDLRGHLTANGLDPGDVARILRRRAAAAGVDGDFAGHSLRRGFITNAAKKKIPVANIQRVTGQRSSRIVLDYVAAANVDDDPPLLEIVGT